MAEPSAERIRLACRLAAVPYGVAAVAYVGLFVSRLDSREIRSGVLFNAMLFGAAAVGLALCRRWGRSLGLLVALAVAGVATLALVSSIVEGDVRPPAALALAVCVALAYALTRPVFSRL